MGLRLEGSSRVKIEMVRGEGGPASAQGSTIRGNPVSAISRSATLRMAHVEVPTFPGLHLTAEYPFPAAPSDPGAGDPAGVSLHVYLG